MEYESGILNAYHPLTRYRAELIKFVAELPEEAKPHLVVDEFLANSELGQFLQNLKRG